MSKRNSQGLSKGSSHDRSESSDRKSDEKSPVKKDKTSPVKTSPGKAEGGGESVKKRKITFGIKPTLNLVQPKKGIQIKIGSWKPAQPAVLMKPPSLTVAAAFNVDDDEEPEKMPPEARMRMRNIGRDTPTSAGPNSFGKTKQGFCDSKKMYEKPMKKRF